MSGANGCYVRHISAGAPKRSHFASRRQNGSSNHINEISAASIGSNGTAKKRVSFGMLFYGLHSSGQCITYTALI